VAKADAYSVTMYLMAGLLFIGLICNLLVRPVNPKHHYIGGRTAPSPALGTVPAAGAAGGRNV
jgi:hypothetical protein